MFNQRIPGVTPDSRKYSVVFHPVFEKKETKETKPGIENQLPSQSQPPREFETYVGCTKQRKVTVTFLGDRWLISFKDNACTQFEPGHSVKITVRLFTAFEANKGSQGIEAVLRGRLTPQERTISLFLPNSDLLKNWSTAEGYRSRRLEAQPRRAGEVEISVEEGEHEKKIRPIVYNFATPSRTTDMVVLMEDGRKIFVDAKFLALHSDFFRVAHLRMPKLPVDPVSNLNCLKIPGISSTDFIVLLHYVYPNPNLEIEGKADILLQLAIQLQFQSIIDRLKVGKIANVKNNTWKLQYALDNGFDDMKEQILSSDLINGRVKDEEFYDKLTNEAKDLLDEVLDKKTSHIELKAYWWRFCKI